MAQRSLVFLILALVWIILSGNFDAFHLTLGFVSCAFVTWISGDLMFADRSKSVSLMLRESLGVVAYMPWLLWEVVVANVDLLYLAVHPSGPDRVEPRIVRYRTYLKSDFARFVFANSITLTPGTITIEIHEDILFIHAINASTAEGLGGEMERRIARIFQEEPR